MTEIWRRKSETDLAFIDLPNDITYELKLFMDLTDSNSQRVNAIMNYYKISYKRNLSWLYLRRLEKDLKSDKIENMADFQLPALEATVSLQREKWIFGEKAIMQYQHDLYMLDKTFHQYNSVWEIQGVEQIQRDIEKPQNTLFLNPFLNCMNLLKTNTEAFEGKTKNYLQLKLAWYNFTRILKTTRQNLKAIRKDRQEYLDSKNYLLKGIKDWSERVGKMSFHGDDRPDYADLYLYGVLKSKMNARSFEVFIEKEFPRNVQTWLIKMDGLCQYQKRYYIND